MLAADKGDVLFKLLHARQQRCTVFTGLHHLLSGLGRVLTRLDCSLSSLRRLLPKRRMGDAKLVRLNTLLR
jgi:hypothetical protein